MWFKKKLLSEEQFLNANVSAADLEAARNLTTTKDRIKQAIFIVFLFALGAVVGFAIPYPMFAQVAGFSTALMFPLVAVLVVGAATSTTFFYVTFFSPRLRTAMIVRPVKLACVTLIALAIPPLGIVFIAPLTVPMAVEGEYAFDLTTNMRVVAMFVASTMLIVLATVVWAVILCRAQSEGVKRAMRLQILRVLKDPQALAQHNTIFNHVLASGVSNGVGMSEMMAVTSVVDGVQSVSQGVNDIREQHADNLQLAQPTHDRFRRLQQSAVQGVVVINHMARNQQELSVTCGQSVSVLEQYGGWLFVEQTQISNQSTTSTTTRLGLLPAINVRRV
jgi:hypothetical protein